MCVLIISECESDLSRILMNSAECRLLAFSEAEKEDLSAYSSIALLCGPGSAGPRVLSAALRIKIEEFAESGKPIFYEWCAGFGYTCLKGDDYNDGRFFVGDAMSRYVYVGSSSQRLAYGDLLDNQANLGCTYVYIPDTAYPLLYNGGHVIKHDHLDASEINTDAIDQKDWRLWYYDKTRLVCSFRIADFVKARFAPFESWLGILELILNHLGVSDIQMPKPHYTLGNGGTADDTFRRAMKWFEGCNVLNDAGKAGAIEGMAHMISPDGVQTVRRNVRMDCVGEVAGAYFFDYLINKNENSLEVYKNLYDFIFDKMQIKDGKFRGMIRWTETAWNTTYGDDTGRAILGNLFYMMYTGDTSRLPEIEASLDILVSVTGSDGLIKHSIHCIELTYEKMKEMASNPSEQWSAHRNAYYSAALLLTYLFTGKKSYLETGVKGLSRIMEVYPNTMRAISETEELCRLIFPLACLYQVTGEEEHKAWLYDVAERLEIYRHKNGGYLEVDPGYTAYRSRTEGTESSMLADNGNEISDLLYSLNWLPLGFSYAYYVTGDSMFMEKWEDIAGFMASAQIVSEDKSIDGAWARCLDVKRMEIYGMPHDVGWGPCCIESGWTVGEIIMGLGFGMALQRGDLPKFPESCKIVKQ